MAGAPENARPAPPQRERPGGIETILSGIRVPDLPYPAGRLRDSDVRDWRPLLASCWSEQRDERVTHVLHSVDLEWSVRQVNAAYVADRIMDVFLKTSGLHPELVRRVARLRFYLAWRMEQDGDEAFGTELIEWLDGLREWRGWSNSGGRSSRVLLEQLDGLVLAVSAAFEGEGKALGSFCLAWQDDSGKRRQQIERLCERLLETERGAASQRRGGPTGPGSDWPGIAGASFTRASGPLHSGTLAAPSQAGGCHHRRGRPGCPAPGRQTA